MARMNWNRAKKHRGFESARDDLAKMADQRSHMILNGQPEAAPPRALDGDRFRSLGSVMHRGGRWYALDRHGQVTGDFATRHEAWSLANKEGMEKI